MKEYKISIKPPRSDTCTVCDEFQVKLDALNPASDQEEITEITMRRNHHHVHAAAGRSFIDVYIKDRTPGRAAIAVDLQQTIPTPHLTTSAQYYKCKLWTYNLGIHNLKTKHPFFHVWNESETKRGSVEVSSCLNHYVNNFIGPGVSSELFFSDNCAGRKKKSTTSSSSTFT